MIIKFVNRGLLNIIEPLNIKEEDIKYVNIGESSIIITLKDNTKYIKHYKLSKNNALKIL